MGDNLHENSARIKLALLLLITFLLIAGAISTAIILSTCCINGYWKLRQEFNHSEEPDYYSHGAVATDQVYCSRVGTQVLKENGSAVDAAIAGAFCLGVLNMHSSGIGGGGAMLVYTKNATNDLPIVDYYDYRETAPSMILNVSSLNGHTVSQGALSIGIPGEIHGMYTAWKDHGRLPWERLLKPAIHLSKNGFIFHKRLYEASVFMKNYIISDPGLKKLLIDENSQDLKANGSMITNAELQATLEIIAKDPMSFYNGELAHNISKEIRKNGGVITFEDLKNYKTLKKSPAKIRFKDDIDIYSSTPPYSGIIVTFILNILKHLNLVNITLEDGNVPPQIYHYLIEAMKFGFAFKENFSDPAFADEKYIRKLSDNLYNETVLKKISRKIDNISHSPDYYSTHVNITIDHGTTQVSAIDKYGNAVSLTNSINIWFGSFYRSLKYGILFNNQMDDFSLPNHTNAYNVEPNFRNEIRPGKRPMSSMSPLMITKNGAPYMTIGASGGTRIITAVASALFYKFWLNDTISEAISRPRIHHQLKPNVVVIDNMFPLSNITQEILSKKYNHEIIQTYIPEYSSVQAVMKEGDKIYAKSDPRKYGQAIGY